MGDQQMGPDLVDHPKEYIILHRSVVRWRTNGMRGFKIQVFRFLPRMANKVAWTLLLVSMLALHSAAQLRILCKILHFLAPAVLLLTLAQAFLSMMMTTHTTRHVRLAIDLDSAPANSAQAGIEVSNVFTVVEDDTDSVVTNPITTASFDVVFHCVRGPSDRRAGAPS